MIEEYYRENRDNLERALQKTNEGKPEVFTWTQELWTLENGGIYRPVGRLSLPMAIDIHSEFFRGPDTIFTVFSDKFFSGEPNYEFPSDPSSSPDEMRKHGYGHCWIDWEYVTAPKIHTIAETDSTLLGVRDHIRAYMELRNKVLTNRVEFDEEGVRCSLGCFSPYQG